MLFQRRFTHADDGKLVSLASKGDEAAFGELLKRHQKSVYGFAFRFVKDAGEAEDIAQEVFLRLYQTAGRYRPDASLKTYLFKITRNLCIDRLRKKHPEIMAHPPEAVEAQTPFDRLSDAESMDRILKAVSGLPDNQREAILLRHDLGMNYKEIADTMGVTVSAVESLLVRARRALRGRLSDLL